jgi:hypothetical protein
MVRSALLRASPDDASHRSENHEAKDRASSFETRAKSALLRIRGVFRTQFASSSECSDPLS